MKAIVQEQDLSIYEADVEGSSRVLVVSTPETRAISNDPFVSGMRYTRTLSRACARTLRELAANGLVSLNEDDTTVLHVLRGGLNFGLRDAIADAFGWNMHNSAFISAQRARKSPDSEEWIITESAYSKIHLCKRNNIVFGDVVATGTSLEYALKRMRESAQRDGVTIESVVFFTIGGPRSHEIISELDKDLKKLFPSYRGSVVVFFEGIFAVASPDSPLSIKIPGTDLLRRDGLIAPEFVESQYENPTFPLERCTIYDAGSRAFDVAEYFTDVRHYWTEVEVLAQKGMTFPQLVKERMPELSVERFGEVSLKDLCHKVLEALPKFPNAGEHIGE